jgi:hypothetical protein
LNFKGRPLITGRLRTGPGQHLPLVAVSIILICCILSAGCIKEGRYYVQDSSIRADRVTASYVTLNVTSTIQNSGGVGSGPLDVRLRAFSADSRLLEAETVTTVPAIGWGASREVSQAVTLPREGSYRLVVAVNPDSTYRGQSEIQVNNLDRLVPDIQQSGLVIDGLDFIVRDTSGNAATIQTDVYVANGGRTGSGPVIVEVKAKELNAGLTADKQQVTLENIDPEKMMMASVPVRVPDQYNYLIEVLIWRDGAVVKRGEGIVRLRPETVVSNDTKIITNRVETAKFVVGQDQMAVSPYSGGIPVTKSPGFGSFAAISSLAALGGLFIIVKRRRI